MVDQVRMSWNSLLAWLREVQAWSLAAEVGSQSAAGSVTNRFYESCQGRLQLADPHALNTVLLESTRGPPGNERPPPSTSRLALIDGRLASPHPGCQATNRVRRGRVRIRSVGSSPLEPPKGRKPRLDSTPRSSLQQVA